MNRKFVIYSMRIMNLTLPYANPLSSAHAHILLLLNGESLNKKPVTVLLRRAILNTKIQIFFSTAIHAGIVQMDKKILQIEIMFIR